MTVSARVIQADIKRTIAAAISAGLAVQRVEVDRDGKIVVVIGPQDDSISDVKDDEEWADLERT